MTQFRVLSGLKLLPMRRPAPIGSVLHVQLDGLMTTTTVTLHASNVELGTMWHPAQLVRAVCITVLLVPWTWMKTQARRVYLATSRPTSNQLLDKHHVFL